VNYRSNNSSKQRSPSNAQTTGNSLSKRAGSQQWTNYQTTNSTPNQTFYASSQNVSRAMHSTTAPPQLTNDDYNCFQGGQGQQAIHLQQRGQTGAQNVIP